MRNKTIRILVKPPGKKPHVEYVRNELRSFQNIVEGCVETVTVADDLVIICNEEGRINGLPYNCSVMGVPFVGTIIFAGVKGDEFASCPRINTDIWIDGGVK